MAEDRAAYLIDIKTGLQDAGIKTATGQVKELTESLHETGKKAEEAHEKVTEGAHKSELSHHELKEAVHAVANQFGGLADVGLWLNPLTAGLAATLFLVEKVRESLKEAKEAAAQLAEQSDKINEARMKGFADAINSAADGMQSLVQDQEKLNIAYLQGSTAMDNRIKQYSAERDAVLKVAEAKEQTFEAEMRYQVELGNISKERADAAIAEAKLRLDAQRGAADSAKLQQEIQERQQELAKAGFRARNSDQQAVDSARAAELPLAADAAASAEAVNQAEKERLKSIFINSSGISEEFSGTADELKARIAEARAAHESAGWKGDTRAMEGYQREIESLEKILHAHEEYVRYLQQVAEHDKQKLAAAKAQTEQAIEQQKHDQEILRTGQDQITVLQKQLDLQQQVTREVEAQHRAAADINAKTAEHEEMRRVQSGKGTAQEQADFASSQAAQFAAHEFGPQAAIDARSAIDRAREIQANLRGQDPRSRDSGAMAELHEILNAILGFQRNQSQELNGLRGEFYEQRIQIQSLESQSRNNRYSP